MCKQIEECIKEMSMNFQINLKKFTLKVSKLRLCSYNVHGFSTGFDFVHMLSEKSDMICLKNISRARRLCFNQS